MKSFWESLDRQAKLGLAMGTALVVFLALFVSWWLLKSNYQVLFSELRPQDAASITTELEKLKIPYEVAHDGGAILVDKAVVHQTRLKLMGKELPLNGAVGLELFNGSDFGMTEFAQKINYQRALQGELTRTILSLSEVKDVRVHLAMAEQGLFKQSAGKSKAAITVMLKQGALLRPDQVAGIQRLVASSVPNMSVQDVTIVNQQGVALNRAGSEAESEVQSSARLDVKRETESYLVKKASSVLEQAFGPGQALVTVDVQLNMDRIKVTTEDAIPAAGTGLRAGQAPAGVVVRERESLRESPSGQEVRPAAIEGGLRSTGASHREIEYQVGRRVEQVVGQPGAVSRVHLVAVVRQALDENQLERLRKMMSAAVGASPDRGDTIVVQSLSQLTPAVETAGDLNAERRVNSVVEPVSGPHRSQVPEFAWILSALAILLGGASASYYMLSRTRKSRALSSIEREQLLAQVKSWLNDSAPLRRAAKPPTDGKA
ncbi:MAG: flagellar M-ring protein FliF [Betaproteobacteria bacterium]|nr:flagellar M-ring protein FliF [Betaproteobacteria bacterium]